jgi:5-formyltetrahydrofolate cyclo-ligase
MLKKDLRRHFLELRNITSEEHVAQASLQIANLLLSLPIWNHTYYHIYLHSTLKKELDTRMIITLLQGKDKEIIVPKISGQNTLAHFLLTDNTPMKENSWGIPEPIEGIRVNPEQIEVVFLPLLGFDKAGNRVGYGKGYYDFFLQECRKEVVKVGLSIFGPVETISDKAPHDIPLDFCVTPDKIYEF